MRVIENHKSHQRVILFLQCSGRLLHVHVPLYYNNEPPEKALACKIEPYRIHGKQRSIFFCYHIQLIFVLFDAMRRQ